MRMFNIAPLGNREDNLVEMFRDMERIFDDFGRQWAPSPRTAPSGKDVWLAPRMDVAETAEALEVTAELPGIAEKDIDLQLEGRTLTLKGQRAETKEDKGKTWHVVERASGSFSRSLTLPFAVDADKVEASFKDGVLHVRLPKPEKAKSEVKKIPLK